MAIGALGTGFFLLTQVNKVLPADTITPHSGTSVAQALGIRTMGVGRLRRYLDSLLHVLPAGELFSGMAAAGQLRR